MKSEESPNRRPAIPTRLGRKRREFGGTLERLLCVLPFRPAAVRLDAVRTMTSILRIFKNFKSIVDSMFRSDFMPITA